MSRLIKKYPNRRLYDTKTSSYITQDDLEKLIKNGECLNIIDTKNNNDITRNVLMQIINDLEDRASSPMFSLEALIQVIKSYNTDAQKSLMECFDKALQMYSDLLIPHYDGNKTLEKQSEPCGYFPHGSRKSIQKWVSSWENLKKK
ncbi:MAG: polyhydroxyalkanoate synthesis regulator DNA-binding domain-containing protein [Francisellaceae bacterium]